MSRAMYEHLFKREGANKNSAEEKGFCPKKIIVARWPQWSAVLVDICTQLGLVLRHVMTMTDVTEIFGQVWQKFWSVTVSFLALVLLEGDFIGQFDLGPYYFALWYTYHKVANAT